MIQEGIEPEVLEAYVWFEDELVKKGFTVKSVLEAREKQKPKKPKEYEDKYLFSSEEALDLVCSYKQTSHIAGMLGSLITSTVVNFITNNASGFDFSPINFFTEFDAQTMNFKIL